jgi:hypothetical protein
MNLNYKKDNFMLKFIDLLSYIFEIAKKNDIVVVAFLGYLLRIV